MRVEANGVRLEIKIVDKVMFETNAKFRGINEGVEATTLEIDALTREMTATLIKGIKALSNMYVSLDKEEK